MSFEIIDNTFQVIVLAAMALLAFLLAFRRSSRSCLILAFGYASFMMGTLYYLLHLIILGHGPQVFYVAECSWMASYFFFLSLEILYWEGLRPPFSPFALAAGVVFAGVVMRVQVFGPSPLMSGALALTFGALAYVFRCPWLTCTGTVGILGVCMVLHGIYNLLITADGFWQMVGYFFPSAIIVTLFAARLLHRGRHTVFR